MSMQVKGCGEANCERLLSSPFQGYLLGLLSACLSAAAGVYTEFLMKKNNDSLHWQNVQLYLWVSLSFLLLLDQVAFGTLSSRLLHCSDLVRFCSFGVLFNMLRLTFDDLRSGYVREPWWNRLFDGYSFVTWLVVFNFGCTGLLVSWVMKYADNIVKVRQ